jgi:hypothetical protein
LRSWIRLAKEKGGTIAGTALLFDQPELTEA